MGPYWITAFLDLAPEEYAAGASHWERLTGYPLSATRGEHGEFATLVTRDGDDFLKVQRLDDGPSRVHVDLHVVDPETSADDAEELGATRLAHRSDYVVMRSPGGFIFCFVDHEAEVRSLPTRWPSGHLSLLDQVCLDIPEEHWATEPAFWSRLTGWDLGAGRRAEYRSLERPDDLPIRLLLQRLEEPVGDVRAHLDWSTTDRAAEVARHVAAGSELVAEHDHWSVLTGPGATYCVTDRDPETGLLPPS